MATYTIYLHKLSGQENSTQHYHPGSGSYALFMPYQAASVWHNNTDTHGCQQLGDLRLLSCSLSPEGKFRDNVPGDPLRKDIVFDVGVTSSWGTCSFICSRLQLCRCFRSGVTAAYLICHRTCKCFRNCCLFFIN